MIKNVPLELQDVPLFDLLDVDPTSMSADELQEMIKYVQEKRTSPQRRRSDNVNAAAKISGKTVDLLKDFS